MRNNQSVRQRGATMVMALVVLAILALFAAWSFKASTGNMKVVGNAQARQEGLSAANAALEETISSATFTTDPDKVAAKAVSIDLDGDGTADASVKLTPAPTCYRVKSIKKSELDATVAADVSCMLGSGGPSGLDSGDVATGDSLCSTSEWALRAEVTDARTSAKTAVNQGVSVRVLSVDAGNACPLP